MAGVAYLHGSEMLPVQKGGQSVQSVRSAVISLVGIAPTGPRQQLIQVLSTDDAAQFGAEIPGFTIPQALAAISDQKASQVLVVNVYDPTTHNAAVTAESVTLVNGRARTAFPPLSVITFASGTLTISSQPVLGTDYTINAFGDIVSLNPTVLPNGQSFLVSYAKLDLSLVSSANILGTVTNTARTGLKLFEQAYTMFGFKPKVIIAPGFSSIAAVAAGLRAEAPKYKAVDIVDAPVGTTFAAAIAGRGPAGTIPFVTNSTRDILAYPHVKRYSAYDSTAVGVTADVYVNMPMSAFLAGIISLTDVEEGYHVSPSNHAIKGIVGIERPLTFDPSDSTGTTEVNQLNAAGIVTVANTYGTGFLVWGNSSAAWPTNTRIDQFIPVQRTRDVLEDSIQYAMMPFFGKNIGVAQLEGIAETTNSFINTLIGREALIEGSECKFLASDNPPTELALGHVTYDLTFCPPPPLQRITFKSTIDINLLSNIKIPSV